MIVRLSKNTYDKVFSQITKSDLRHFTDGSKSSFVLSCCAYVLTCLNYPIFFKYQEQASARQRRLHCQQHRMLDFPVKKRHLSREEQGISTEDLYLSTEEEEVLFEEREGPFHTREG
jgi:hypothetical protein